MMKLSESSPSNFPTVSKILRTVPDENAFYFYKTIGYYLDVRARSLEEFSEKLKTIDSESIAFHLSRWDFGNWLMTTVGDATLARLVSTLKDAGSSALDAEQLRGKLSSLVHARLSRLRKLERT
jgi:Family of unknown function (DUF5752)